MRAGGLDRRVTLQRKTVVQDPDSGADIETWADLATVFAQVRQQSGKEYLAAGGIGASVRVVFYLRYFPDLTVLDRVSYSDRLHNIEEVREIGRRDGVELHTVAATP